MLSVATNTYLALCLQHPVKTDALFDLPCVKNKAKKQSGLSGRNRHLTGVLSQNCKRSPGGFRALYDITVSCFPLHTVVAAKDFRGARMLYVDDMTSERFLLQNMLPLG